MTAVSTYGFINAKLRARISKLLPEEFFRALARAHSIIEAMGRLDGTPYAPAAEIYNSTGDIKLCELELIRVERESLSGLDRYIPDAIRPFTDAVLQQYEVATLKHALRLWFERTVRGRRVDDKIAYLLRDNQVNVPTDALINADSADEVVAALADTPYGTVVAEALVPLPERQSLFTVEVALDRWYFRHLIEATSTLGRKDAEVARRLVGIQIDIQNVNWLVRMKHYYGMEPAELASSIVSGGTLLDATELREAYLSDRPVEPLVAALGPRYSALVRETAPAEERSQLRRLALLEDLLRSVLFQEIHRALGGYPFSIGTVLAYFLLVQNEVRVLITVLNARFYDLSPERIEDLI